MGILVNLLAFQVGWFACVLGAAHGMPALGAGVAVALSALHIARADRAREEAIVIASAAALGLVGDSVIAASGLIRYENGQILAGTAPYWIIAMWMIFATTLNVSLRWLRGRWVLAAGLGAIAGPLAYFAGARLGAASFPAGPAGGLLAIAFEWIIAMPLLMLIAERHDGISSAVDAKDSPA